jgi:hypothetical protein
MKRLRHKMKAIALIVTLSLFASCAGNSAKKGYRKAKDETCELINGKIECALQKAKHTLQNAGDDIEEALED